MSSSASRTRCNLAGIADDGTPLPRPFEGLAEGSPSTRIPARVYVCRGKKCRKKTAQAARALTELDPLVEIRDVGCQKICDGPVFGVEDQGHVEWFERVETDKARAALRALTRTGELRKPLAKRRIHKRSGRRR